MLGLALLVASLSAEAQPGDRTPRVGVLLAGSPPSQGETDALREGLRELGYVEGRTITIESRWAERKEERFPDLAAELVRAKVDVIVATVAAAVPAARQATPRTPIVMVVNDPMATGFVTTLARPGGTITGLSMMSPELVGKQVELLKNVAPRISRLAVLWNPANPGHPPQLQRAETAARTQAMQLQPLKAQTLGEIDRAFATMTRERADALLVLLDPILYRQREHIADLAAKRRLPAMYTLRQEAEAGGLMAYGANLFGLYRRAAVYVDKILKGAKPGDLPIEQPTKFELIINLKTGKALGLTIPPSVLVRADHLIDQ
jgi:putative ABC transport system substrate-binding protein